MKLHRKKEINQSTDESQWVTPESNEFPSGKTGKKKKKPIYKRPWFIILVILIVFGAISSATGSSGEVIDWPTLVLKDKLPTPPSVRGELHENSAERLRVDLSNISDEQYTTYLNECIDMGYTVDADTTANSYEAYDSEGYSLRLSHTDVLYIRLDAPMEFESITWPSGTAGQRVPAPKSTVGKFSYEHDDHFRVYVGETPREDYNEYVTACADAGFTVDYSKDDDYYRADSTDGFHVSLKYEGNNIMVVEVEKLDEEETNSTETTPAAETESVETEPVVTETPIVDTVEPVETVATTIDLSSIPEYTGDPYVEVNGNVPSFAESDFTTTSFETYSNLDSLGRCGVAYANIGQDLMPTEERGSIGSVKPSGWHTVRYNGVVDGNYLYNRCHLIGYQLTAENANEKNLITGTRYLNVEGMLPFENMVADYIKETNNHVLYRVTPIFDGNNLVASGVLMEAESVEDKGDGILFCVYCYNVQPNITIDYATGESSLNEGVVTTSEAPASQAPVVSESPVASQVPVASESPATSQAVPSEHTYILNTSSKKFHDPSCSSVGQMSESNKQEYTGTRDDVINMGYDPCKRCNP